jgi:DNA-binding CsgD family transcriptional regulator
MSLGLNGDPTIRRRTSLLGRTRELAEIDRLLTEAARGEGRGLLVEGPAGIGKTALIDEASERGAASGLSVLSARGGELEVDLSFGIVRQLFEQPLAARPEKDLRRVAHGGAGPALRLLDPVGEGVPGSTASAPDEVSLVHSLYRLVSNLAERGPLLIAVDDVQWADRPSQRWLAYLARRLSGHPALLLLGRRTGDREAEGETIDAIAGEPSVAVVRPSPLSEPEVAELVGRSYASVDDEFCRAFHRAGAGNPFITVELIAAAVEEKIPPTAESSGQITGLGPESVARDVLRRIARLGSGSERVARAVAILGTDVELGLAADLAELSADDASSAADALADARVLRRERPLEFIHPVVRSVVREEIGIGERSRAHLRAAHLLDARGDPEAAAAHLLTVDPTGDSWIVDMLRNAAAVASAPELAATYMRRALEEPPAPDNRVDLLLELGRFEEAALDESAVGHLMEARALAEDDFVRAQAGYALAGALFWSGQPSEAVDAGVEAIRDLLRSEAGATEQGRELRRLLEVELWVSQQEAGAMPPDRFEQLHALVGEKTTFGERAICAALAYMAPFAGVTWAAGRDFAVRALAGPTSLENESGVRLFYFAVWGLEFADELELADDHLRRAVDEARERSSPSAMAFARTALAIVTCRRAPPWARADAEAALALAREHEIAWLVPLAGGALADALNERAELQAADEVLARTPAPRRGEGNVTIAAFHRHNRGRLRLAQGNVEEALEDFLDSGRMMRDGENDHPAYYPWRSGAALAHMALGRRHEAKPLVDEEVEMARAFGAGRSLGLSLRTAGLVEGGQSGVQLLREAVDVLEESPAEIERARAVVELGSALRRLGERTEAAAILRRGLELADRCNSVLLTVRAREELHTIGARPRRAAISGLGALTRSEERVARLAAEGLTNREIAQKLVVSPKTVENQLGHVFRKLDVSSRKELPEALRAETP